jgi:hypothetical protein
LGRPRGEEAGCESECAGPRSSAKADGVRGGFALEGDTMTRSRRFAHIGLSSARWLLPWILVLFVSATLAYGMNIVIGESASGEAATTATTREQSATLSTSGLADGDDVRARFLATTATAETHDATLQVGTTWVVLGTCAPNVKEGQSIACDPAERASGGTFGVTSSATSPAYTGHASPEGCCTWD